MNDVKQIAQLCDSLLKDQEALRKVSDRVYELFQEEVRNERDRMGYIRSTWR